MARPIPGEVRKKFLVYVKNVSVKRPHLSLLYIVCVLRGSILNGKNPQLIPLVNYGSYLMEANPGLANMPFILWPNNIKL